MPGGVLGHTHLLEALAYISTEIHKSFKPFLQGGSDSDKAAASATITRRMTYLAQTMDGEYLFGAEPGVADFYLFVMLLWAAKFGVTLPEPLPAFRDRLMERTSVRTAMKPRRPGLTNPCCRTNPPAGLAGSILQQSGFDWIAGSGSVTAEAR